MQIQEAIKTINQMQADEVIDGYAIGRAVGAAAGGDKARVLQFIEAGVLDSKQLHEILSRHNLQAKWQQFAKQFLSDA